MSESLEHDIVIEDLPAEETLTPEEKERLAGAGRPSFRPTLEAFEARELMATNVMAGVAPAVIGATIRTTEPAPTTPTVETPTGVSQGSVTGVNLSGMDLTKTDLSGINLNGANLSGANLTGVDLSGRDLSGANLSGANLTRANLSGANLTDADLRAAKLDGAKLDGAKLDGAKLDGAKLGGAAPQSTDQQDIRQKLEQIKLAVANLQAMDVADLPYAQWLDGQSEKNQVLTAADETELKLKQSEIEKLKGHPDKATILADEEIELAIMKVKMAKMTDLQTAIEQAQQGQLGADQRVAGLMLDVSFLELSLKKQQVSTLEDQIKSSSPDKQPALEKLLEGEQYEVKQLEKINALNLKIAYQVATGGNTVTIADLRREVTHHELLMKEQNMRQLEARLKSDAA